MRARRRSERAMAEAFEAVAAGDLELADKISRRVIAEASMNPRLWNERGEIAALAGHLDEAEECYRTAIRLAPEYADAFANLARLQESRGRHEAAARLGARAAALRGEGGAGTVETPPAAPAPEAPAPPVPVRAAAWEELGRDLEARGIGALRGFLGAAECARLAALWDDEIDLLPRQELPVGAGAAGFRYAAEPLPPPLAELRAELYAGLRPVADRLHAEVGRPPFPPDVASFLQRCAAAGQVHCGTRLYVTDSGAETRPERRAAGHVRFPFEAWACVGPADARVSVDVVDDRPGRHPKRHGVDLEPGTVAIACAPARPVRVAGVVGLQPVAALWRAMGAAVLVLLAFEAER